jgi:hypothetical protein
MATELNSDKRVSEVIGLGQGSDVRFRRGRRVLEEGWRFVNIDQSNPGASFAFIVA